MYANYELNRQLGETCPTAINNLILCKQGNINKAVNQAERSYLPGLAAACSVFFSKGQKQDKEHKWGKSIKNLN